VIDARRAPPPLAATGPFASSEGDSRYWRTCCQRAALVWRSDFEKWPRNARTKDAWRLPARDQDGPPDGGTFCGMKLSFAAVRANSSGSVACWRRVSLRHRSMNLSMAGW